MDYIILDIEFNGRKFASELPMEVLEIGAVRLDEQLRVVDEFSCLIRPLYFAKLNSFIKKKTGIPQEGIDRAERFPKVIQAFIDWLSRSDKYMLVTWGGEDMKRIVQDTRLHKLDDTLWLQADYYDLLKGYLRFKQLKNDVSVEAAMLELGIESDGTAHRALEDAKMTAEVFRRVFPSLHFEEAQRYRDVFSNAKERRLVKMAIRTLTMHKKTPTWELVYEKYLKDKIPLDDPRKVEELRQYCEEALAKPVRIGGNVLNGDAAGGGSEDLSADDAGDEE
ncbi:3'-5' exonuclease [Paenibacillus koleovorans]|uniref:3'-5' exonuclease n=1 Tax=Paenibacillus koleovorans TaxID=121608 RepID=UPI000FDC8AFE|nr:3'-5' exonuclease [Paenibacillus koleovorans]